MPMTYVARAIEMSETRGFMKAIVDPRTGEILGCTILGVEGGELMSMLEIAMLGEGAVPGAPRGDLRPPDARRIVQQPLRRDPVALEVCRRSPDRNAARSSATPRPNAIALKSSPISDGLVSLLAAAASGRYRSRRGRNPRHHLGQPAVHEQLRLRRVAEHVRRRRARLRATCGRRAR